MKKLITIVAGVLLVNFSALAQGTILLSNIGPGLNSGVKDASGVLIPAGASYTIELLAGTAASSVAAFTPAITTTTWVGNGWFGVGDPEKVLPGNAAGSLPFFALRAWNNTGGVTDWATALGQNKAFYVSPAGTAALSAFQLTGGGLGNPNGVPTPTPAGQLFGMPTGFQLVPVPEPSTIVLGVLGAAALLLRRRK